MTDKQNTAASERPLDCVVGRYRLLEQNEVIENGDEFLEDDCITWTRVPIDGGDMCWQRWMIGKKWNPMMNVPFRRFTPNMK